MSRFKSEADFARGIVASFRERGYTVYQEVAIYSGDKRADIVAVRRDPQIVTVIETKLCLSLQLMEQCETWLPYAHRVYAAAPVRLTRFAERTLLHFGIGLLDSEGEERVRARFLRKPPCVDVLLKKCIPEREDFAEAGNAKGEFWSPWKATCRAVAAFVAKYPGCSLKQIVESVNHHYRSDSSARQTIARDVQLGRVAGVRCEREGRRLAFFAEAAP